MTNTIAGHAISSRRVVVTGTGAVSPIGNTVPEFWASLKAGVCGVGKIASFDLEDLYIHIGAEVKGFEAKERLSGLKDRTLPMGFGVRARQAS